MAQAAAVHTKIALIATMRFNMVVSLSTLSAAPPNPACPVGIVKYFALRSKGAPGEGNGVPGRKGLRCFTLIQG